MKIFIVLCQYDGCDLCSGGAHIVGVYTDEKKAKQIEYAHDATPKIHHHYFTVETIEYEIQIPNQ